MTTQSLVLLDTLGCLDLSELDSSYGSCWIGWQEFQEAMKNICAGHPLKDVSIAFHEYNSTRVVEFRLSSPFDHKSIARGTLLKGYFYPLGFIFWLYRELGKPTSDDDFVIVINPFGIRVDRMIFSKN